MPRVTTLRRIAIIGVVALVLLAVVAAITVVTVSRRPFPQTSGEVDVPGLESQVEVIRDSRGVPHIYADTPEDLFKAQGYVAAQDRFFQMDLRRHITSGRLSELVGEPGLESDKVVRTMGWQRIAERELPMLDSDTQAYLEAYAEGVNAYIDQRESPGRLALEYVVLGQQVPLGRIEPWTAVDSLAWLKAMAWDLRDDYSDELLRGQLAADMPRQQIDTLFPEYPVDAHPPILSADDWEPGQDAKAGASGNGSQGKDDEASGDALSDDAGDSSGGSTDGGPSAPPTTNASAKDWAPDGDELWTGASAASAQEALRSTSTVLSAVPELVGQGPAVGSNSWVVSGKHTESGKPLVANDPHLATSNPGVWYQSGLHCRKVTQECPFDVSGFTFAGLPGVIIGHNSDLAWAFTNLGSDVTDFYLHRTKGDEYLRDGEWTPLETRMEIIEVAGQDHPETIEVRTTAQGPIVSDVLGPIARVGKSGAVARGEGHPGYDVALAWTALQPNRTADAIFAMNKATDPTSFREAARSFAVPAQNLIYADKDGNIGYQAPGQVPIRRSSVPGAAPGVWPAPGWNSAYDWRDYVPFEELPHVENPDSGRIVTANQPVTAFEEPHLASSFDYGYRALRIHERLDAIEFSGRKLTSQDMTDIQMDDVDPFAAQLVPALLRIDLSDDQFVEEAQQLLEGYNGRNGRDRNEEGAAAAFYNAVWAQVVNLTFNDQLPQSVAATGGDRERAIITELLKDPTNSWWDDKTTPGVVEGRDEILRQALVGARSEMTRHVGKDIDDWSWGNLHRMVLRHQVLGGKDVPKAIQWVFNYGPRTMPGGSSLVNANAYDASSGQFQVTTAPSMRMVVDLADLDSSTWVDQSGVSGHPFHKHFDDQVEAWIAGRTYPWPHSRQAVEADRQDTLTLKPAPQE